MYENFTISVSISNCLNITITHGRYFLWKTNRHVKYANVGFWMLNLENKVLLHTVYSTVLDCCIKVTPLRSSFKSWGYTEAMKLWKQTQGNITTTHNKTHSLPITMPVLYCLLVTSPHTVQYMHSYRWNMSNIPSESMAGKFVPLITKHKKYQQLH